MNFASILSATHTAIVSGSTVDAAAKTGFAVVKKDSPTLAVLLREERASTQVKLGMQAAYRALVAGMRAVLVADKIDVSDTGIVRDALRAEVWLDEGYAVALAKSKAAPLSKADMDAYQRVSQRISRLARDVVANDKPAAQKVKAHVPVRKTTQAAIKALVEGGATKKELLEAIARAFA